MPLTKSNVQFANEDEDEKEMEHLRARRSLESDAPIKNLINAFEELTRPQQNQVAEVICGRHYLPQVDLQRHNNVSCC